MPWWPRVSGYPPRFQALINVSVHCLRMIWSIWIVLDEEESRKNGHIFQVFMPYLLSVSEMCALRKGSRWLSSPGWSVPRTVTWFMGFLQVLETLLTGIKHTYCMYTFEKGQCTELWLSSNNAFHGLLAIHEIMAITLNTNTGFTSFVVFECNLSFSTLRS